MSAEQQDIQQLTTRLMQQSALRGQPILDMDVNRATYLVVREVLKRQGMDVNDSQVTEGLKDAVRISAAQAMQSATDPMPYTEGIMTTNRPYATTYTRPASGGLVGRLMGLPGCLIGAVAVAAFLVIAFSVVALLGLLGAGAEAATTAFFETPLGQGVIFAALVVGAFMTFIGWVRTNLQLLRSCLLTIVMGALVVALLVGLAATGIIDLSGVVEPVRQFVDDIAAQLGVQLGDIISTEINNQVDEAISTLPAPPGGFD